MLEAAGGAKVTAAITNEAVDDLGLKVGDAVRADVLAKTAVQLDWEIKRLGAFRPGAEVEPFLGK